jgi:F-type H+-transporting ATPase subunit delta
MRPSLLADRYALALRAAIGDPARLEKTSDALNALAALYQDNADARNVLINPVVPLSDRERMLDAILSKLDTAPEAAQLLRRMLARNRMPLLPALASRFEEHINEWLNRVEVTVVTAAPLTPELEAKLIEGFQKFTGKGVYLKSKVDLNIIGGLVVYMWGVFIDFSLRTRLERLKQKLLTEETLTI